MANRYWVGDAGTWDATSTTHWSASSGGAAGASAPTSSDDVIFDANSFSAGSQTVTVSNAVCRNFTSTAVTHAPSFELLGTDVSAWDVYGNWAQGTMSITQYDSAYLSFTSTALGKTILSLHSVATAIYFNGIGGGWSFSDNPATSLGAIVLLAGSLDLNGHSFACGGFQILGTDTKVLTLGSGTLTLIGDFRIEANSSNLTINKGTSTITPSSSALIYNFSAQTFELYNVSLNLITNQYNPNPFIFDSYAILRGITSFNDLSIITGLVFPSTPSAAWPINNDFTVTGTLTVTGKNQNYGRFVVYSAVSGTQFIITAAVTVLTNVDFMDIIGAGAGTWSGTSIGNGGNCSGITFTTPIDLYWIGGTGTWSTTTKWSLTSGGASAGKAPLCHDNVFFDVNSFSGSGQSVLGDIPFLGRNIDWTGVTHNPTFTPDGLDYTSSASIFGSLTLVNSMTIGYSSPCTVVFDGRYDATFVSAGLSFNFPYAFDTALIEISKGYNTLTLGDDLSAFSIFAQSGILDADTHDVTINSFYTGSSGSSTTYDFTLLMGSGTWTFTNILIGDPSFNIQAPIDVNIFSVSIDSGTANIIFDLTHSNGTQAIFFLYDNFSFNDVTVNGSDSFGGFYPKLTIENDMNLNLNILTLSDENQTLVLSADKTVNTTSFSANGVNGANIKIRSTIPGTQAFLSANTVSVSYVDVQDNYALGNAIPFQNIPGTDSGNNTNWYINAVSNLYLQNVQMVAVTTAGDVQTINVGKGDDGTPIYFELETQEQEFGDRSNLKKMADQIVVFAKDAGESILQVSENGKNPRDVVMDLSQRVNIGESVNLEGNFFSFIWSGQSNTTSPVFEGLYIKDISDIGLTKG